MALYVLGVYLAMHVQPAWFLYFGAWIFVIVALVGEGSRVFHGACCAEGRRTDALDLATVAEPRERR